MILYGIYPSLRARLASESHFQPALDYLDRVFGDESFAAELLSMEPGQSARRDLEAGCFAMEQAYLTRTRSECYFESHRSYIDVQAVIAGEEWIEVADRSLLRERQPYDEGRDLVIYEDYTKASRLRLSPGHVAVFFPEDAHQPCLRTGEGAERLVKTVIKVPVPR